MLLSNHYTINDKLIKWRGSCVVELFWMNWLQSIHIFHIFSQYIAYVYYFLLFIYNVFSNPTSTSAVLLVFMCYCSESSISMFPLEALLCSELTTTTLTPEHNLWFIGFFVPFFSTSIFLALENSPAQFIKYSVQN